MKEMEYIPQKTLDYFRMIEEYNLMMSMPHAEQKTVLTTLLGKYPYKSFDSIKQTFARLKRNYPEKFNTQKHLV